MSQGLGSNHTTDLQEEHRKQCFINTGFLCLSLSSIITVMEVSEGGGIPAELLDVLKDDATKAVI